MQNEINARKGRTLAGKGEPTPVFIPGDRVEGGGSPPGTERAAPISVHG